MKKSMYSGLGSRLRSGLIVFSVVAITYAGWEAQAIEWTKITSVDGKISVLLPSAVDKSRRTQVDSTAAGKVETVFGIYEGDGILVSGSGSGIPGIAKLLGANVLFNNSKKRLLAAAEGQETSFAERTVGPHPARHLKYTGKNEEGEYIGEALLVLIDKRMYIIQVAMHKQTPENMAIRDKIAESIQAN
jgi:hypothetical protein